MSQDDRKKVKTQILHSNVNVQNQILKIWVATCKKQFTVQRGKLIVNGLTRFVSNLISAHHGTS